MPNHKQMLTRIVSSDPIKKLLAAYEEARPKGLGCSYLPPSSPATASSSDASSFQGTIDVATGAIATQVLGWRGGAMVVGAQAASDAWGLVKDWWGSNTKEDLYLNLHYLSSVNVENENTNVPAVMAVRLRQLYNLAYTYQSQKMSRGWLNLGIGANYTEGVINDQKYLAAILIGRKIQFALLAASYPEYESQMCHLEQFIEKLTSDMPEIFDTKSNDAVYLSLITLVKNIKQAQIDADIAKANADICQQIKYGVHNIQRRCSNLMRAMKNDMLYGVTAFTPDLLKRYHIQDQRRYAEAVKNFSLIENIFLAPKLDVPVSGQDLAKLLSDASKVQVTPNDEVVTACKKLLDKQREVVGLNAVLEKIEKLIELTGHVGISYILDDLYKVMDKMQQSYVDLLSLRHEFIKHLLNLDSPALPFKVKQLRYARRLDSDDLHAQMIRLFGLAKNVSPKELRDNVTSEARGLVLDIQKEVKSLCGEGILTFNDNAIPEKIIKATEQRKSIEQERVERLEKQAEMLSREIGKMLKEQEEDREERARLQLELDSTKAELAAEREKIKELEARLGVNSESVDINTRERLVWSDTVQRLTTENDSLKTTNKSLKSTVEQYTSAENARMKSLALETSLLEDDKPPRRKRSKVMAATSSGMPGAGMPESASSSDGLFQAGALSCLQGLFSVFINQYIRQPRPRAVCLWHRHGSTGIKMAENVRDMWVQKSANVLAPIILASADDMFDQGVGVLLRLLNDMIASDFITGNFHKHSLKTYILQFHNYLLSGVKPEALMGNMDDIFKSSFTDKVALHSTSGIKAKWNGIVEHHRIHDRIMSEDKEPSIPVSRS